jgi:hypothetical protein
MHFNQSFVLVNFSLKKIFINGKDFFCKKQKNVTKRIFSKQNVYLWEKKIK